MTAPQHIALIGCGKMGRALLDGWLNADINAEFLVIDPHAPDINHPRVTTNTAANESLKACDTILLAVKPQIMAEICATLKPHTAPNALIISIAAGQTLNALQSYFHDSQPIIRTMPNTPAAIGKGMTVAVPNTKATDAHRAMATQLLQTSGKLEWVSDETLMDAVTALSGSGPAYIFHLIEALAKAGQSVGLPAEMAETLARQTVIGSAALAEQSADTPAKTLRENVTSPGGTTAAALERLMDGEFQRLLNDTLKAARDRGRELG